MAKKQSSDYKAKNIQVLEGLEALKAKAAQRKMAKVIISTKNDKGKYAYKEVMVDQENVQEFIQQNKG